MSKGEIYREVSSVENNFHFKRLLLPTHRNTKYLINVSKTYMRKFSWKVSLLSVFFRQCAVIKKFQVSN